MKLRIFPNLLAVCRLEADAAIPDWPRGEFLSVTRTPEELSIVCDEASVPGGVLAERGWRALQLIGPIPFEVTGVAASLSGTLAAGGISLFLISTYDTDWVLVKEMRLDAAVEALRRAGYDVA